MKINWKEIILAAFLGLILPALILRIFILTAEEVKEPENTESTSVTTSSVQEESDLTMFLRRSDGSVTEMDLDTYLIGVVLAEMPADFEAEALKAQAVVARTYTCKALATGGKHGDGSVCTDSTCCQGYISQTDYLAQGGEVSEFEKISDAVYTTSGYVLTYEGQLIEATYFSCSGGTTEDAVAVWGTDYPYLRATDSPGEENATHYSDTVTFTKEEFADKLGLSITGKPTSWLGYVTYTAGGGVATMEIGGKTYKGTEIRSLLGLRSTVFTMTAGESSISVTTKGYGHRVGMSQYGADAMAVSGSSYAQILAHYYQGTALTKLGQN